LPDQSNPDEPASFFFHEVEVDVHEFWRNNLALSDPVLVTVLGASPAEPPAGPGTPSWGSDTDSQLEPGVEVVVLLAEDDGFPWREGRFRTPVMVAGEDQGVYVVGAGDVLDNPSPDRSQTVAELRAKVDR
jgi:hypothetical protein